ncbi:MAG: response regulator [Pseudomonadota bacterium]
MAWFDLSSPRRAYTIGLALIAVLVTVQFVGLRVATLRQEVSALEINLSGRQRMLSQRIALIGARLGDLDAGDPRSSSLRNVLANCVHLMANSQAALQLRSRNDMRLMMASGVPCLSGELGNDDIPVNGPVELDEPVLLNMFLSQAWAVASGQASSTSTIALSSLSDGPLGALLLQLDQATLSAQKSSTSQLQRLLSYNWVLILLLVVAELLLIFRPMASAVETSIRRLRDANNRLERSESRLRDFASTAAHQLWETDTSFRFTWIGASDQAFRIASDNQYLGSALWELPGVDPGDDTDWRQHRDTLEARLSFMNLEYAIVDSDGVHRWWRSHGRPVFDDQGEFLGYRGTSQEITKEREAAAKLRRSDRMRALGQLTAGVAHDFNNLLAVIQANAEIAMAADSDAAWRESADEIVTASRRGAALTHRLLAFGRVQRLRKEAINLHEFFRSLERLLRRTLGEDFIVKALLPEEFLWVLADRHQLEDACVNLALNARDAAKPGGTLTISATSADPARVVSTLGVKSKSAEYVQLVFRDDGEGIPDAIKDQIFEPFFTTKNGEGSGLGLSMVYGFVHQSDGFIDVSSDPSQGTSFELFLPRASARNVGTEVRQPLHRVFGAGQRALLVEDNEALRRVIRRHLSSLGFEVATAADGATAVETVRHDDPFDLVILDIVLPGGLDGIDVYRQVRQHDPSVDVLFCSGFTGLERRQDQLDDVPGFLLRKPFSVEQLTEAISEVLTPASDGGREKSGNR